MDKYIVEILRDFHINPWEYQKLELIGGHSKFHLEGNALTHSMMVFNAALDMFPTDVVMQKAALLHDIGKIYTSIEVLPGDWIYPDHSLCGSFKGILAKFIPLDEENFINYQWLIKNHIRPLYWREKGINVDTTPYEIYRIDPQICNEDNLRRLAICDLKGSLPLDKKASEDLIRYLEDLML